MPARICPAVLAALGLASTAALAGTGDFHFQLLDVPGAQVTAPAGINSSGAVVGGYFARGASHGFLYSSGTFTTLDAPGATRTMLWGINDRGFIVGESVDASGLSHGFIYSGGTFATIDAPRGARGTSARGINASGHVAGTYVDESSVARGFLWTGRSFVTLNVPGAWSTRALGVSDSGEVIGEFSDASGIRGFTWREGVYGAFPQGPGVRSFTPRGINGAGLVAGAMVGSTGRGARGFLFDLRLQALVSLDVPGATETRAAAVSGRGVIAGEYLDARGATRGFLAWPEPARN